MFNYRSLLPHSNFVITTPINWFLLLITAQQSIPVVFWLLFYKTHWKLPLDFTNCEIS